ncbi:MAG: hypothetical protein SXG53_25635 [Pseudomonadota bacterium]|nr:hypothetical protein [Pseudomonadota bacterium]
MSECLRRAAAAGLDRWEAITALDEPELERRLYPTTAAPIARKPRPLPDWTTGRGSARNWLDAITR